MYFSLSNMVKSLFGGSSETQEPIKLKDDEDHTYSRGLIENRGPCPGLNSLANHGYLPRDGQKITIPHVDQALRTGLRLSKAQSRALTNSLKPLIKNDGTFDLFDVRRHNVIEHDASFTRLDFHQGDNYTFQPHMFQAMLNDARGGPITRRSLARTFIRRDKESQAAGAPKLPLNLRFVRIFEAVGLVDASRLGGTVPVDVATVFYTEERFSDVILENKRNGSLFSLLRNAMGMMFWVGLMKIGLVEQ